MDMQRISLTKFLSLMIVLFLSSGVSTFTFERTSSGQRHIMVKRSHPSEFHNIPHQKPHYGEGPQQSSVFEDVHHWPNIRHEGHGSHHPSIKEEKEREKTLKMALGEEGLTRVVYDDDDTFTDDDEDDYYYDALLPLTNGNDDKDHHKKIFKEMKEEKKMTESFPKKFPHDTKEKKGLEKKKQESHTKIFFTETDDEITHHADHSEEEKEDSLAPNSEKIDKKKNSNPLVLPVTTEGKQKTEDPLIVYGFPKELLPIMPGGGSRFEDVEREKLEKKKMSQMKGDDDDSAENGGGHEAEGLYSSASLSSISLCVYWLASFHHLDRLFLL